MICGAFEDYSRTLSDRRCRVCTFMTCIILNYDENMLVKRLGLSNFRLIEEIHPTTVGGFSTVLAYAKQTLLFLFA